MKDRAGLRRATLSVREAAAILGVSLDSVYDAIRRKQIPSLSIGRRRLVPLYPLLHQLGAASAPTTSPDGPDMNRKEPAL